MTYSGYKMEIDLKYRGWHIYGMIGKDAHWYAYRHGVRMNVKSDDMTLIKQMIDNHEDDHENWVKSRNN